MDCILKNLTIYTDGAFKKGDISIDGGRVVSVLPGAADAGALCFDFSDSPDIYAFPGFADVHVHLREPGFSYKETIRTGTMAAARGGYTDVCAMPNLAPVPDSAEHLEAELAVIRRDAVIRVRPYGAISAGEKGEKLSDMTGMADSIVAFSDDGRGVQSAGMMEKAMTEAKRLGKIIAAHCEDEALLKKGGCVHDGEYAKAHGLCGIPSRSEWKQVERDLELVRRTGCAYHVCHVSTKESVELIRRARAEGLDVTCETAPHYLVFDDSQLLDDGRFKMNPPIRAAEDKEALIQAVCDGAISMIATDHAPHSAAEKAGGLRDSLNGVVGLETAFPALYTALVKTGVLPLSRLVELMSVNPKRRFGAGGSLSPGETADFCVFDLSAEYYVNPADFLSMGRATPFEGMRLSGKCLMTVLGGRPVYTEKTLGGKYKNAKEN